MIKSMWATLMTMAKSKEHQKWKSASKDTKAPMKNMAWKKTNTQKQHVSDTSDDDTSSSDHEPPPKWSRHAVEEISNDQPESDIQVLDDQEVCFINLWNGLLCGLHLMI